MKRNTKAILFLLLLSSLLFILSSCAQQENIKEVKKYEPTWESLKHHTTPQWLRDAKFGIYTHWGIYCYTATRGNATWNSHAAYVDPDSKEAQDFYKKYGKVTPDFGYKDLIPKFTAEKFNAEEWADLFAKSGAKFAGPVAEHHDGFAMWDTKYSDWNAAKMGPHRDVVGELEKAIKAKGMKFVTAFHHAANWFFFPVHDKRYDTGDPKNSGLYGQHHLPGEMRNQAFIDEWYNKIIEVIDNYGPDFIWFDFALDSLPEGYVKDFLAYYYNYADRNNKEVVVTYKGHDLIPGSGVRDLELGQEPEITYHDWITDTSVDDRGAWGWAEDLTFKTPDRLIDNLIDRVSKNGYLLLNVGPKPDGTIPEGAKNVLLEMGSWLKVNGEAIYGTTPWFIAGEGPTNLGETSDIGFNESGIKYTKEDVRFTTKGDDLYVTFLDWPGETAFISTIRATDPESQKMEIPEWAIPASPGSLAGTTWEVEDPDIEDTFWKYEFTDNKKVKISRDENSEMMEGSYKQVGTLVKIKVDGDTWTGSYDGKEFSAEDLRPRYPGIYKEEIKRISLLGDGNSLEWVISPNGLAIKTPQKKGKYAYVFKVERYHHPQLEN